MSQDLLSAWDDLNMAINRMLTASPASMSDAAVTLEEARQNYWKVLRSTSMAAPSALADSMENLARQHALEGIKASRWYRSAPAKHRRYDPSVTLSGIEYHPVYSSQGGVPQGATTTMPFVCGETEVGGIKAAFRLRLDFGQGGFVIDEKSLAEN